jgi:hypothetical protein
MTLLPRRAGRDSRRFSHARYGAIADIGQQKFRTITPAARQIVRPDRVRDFLRRNGLGKKIEEHLRQCD